MKLKIRSGVTATLLFLMVFIFGKGKHETLKPVPDSDISTGVVYEVLDKPEVTVSELAARETEGVIFEEETLVEEDTFEENTMVEEDTFKEETLVEEVIFEENTMVEELLPEEDIRLIALVTMAEAEGESEQGKRLVISTILNRVDSEHFPNTVHDVIYQPSQFSAMWNGRVNRCEVRDDIYKLVVEELKDRSNYDVIFFTAGKYGKYGVPMFQVGNHYFASY